MTKDADVDKILIDFYRVSKVSQKNLGMVIFLHVAKAMKCSRFEDTWILNVEWICPLCLNMCLDGPMSKRMAVQLCLLQFFYMFLMLWDIIPSVIWIYGTHWGFRFNVQQKRWSTSLSIAAGTFESGLLQNNFFFHSLFLISIWQHLRCRLRISLIGVSFCCWKICRETSNFT